MKSHSYSRPSPSPVACRSGRCSALPTAAIALTASELRREVCLIQSADLRMSDHQSQIPNRQSPSPHFLIAIFSGLLAHPRHLARAIPACAPSYPRSGAPVLASPLRWQARVTEPTSRFLPFAHAPKLCETRSMRKLPNIAISLLAATLILAGTAAAQQTPATTPSTTPAANAPPSGDSSTPAAKPATSAKPAAKSGATSATKPQAAAKTPSAAQSSTQSGTAAKTSTGAAAQHHAAAAPLVLKTDKDKQSYAIGMNIGKSIHRDGVDVDPNILLRGMKDALAGGKTVLTDDEAKAIMTNLQADMRKQQAEKAQLAGEAFLAENKTKEGVVTLPSGLQYKILTEGTGPKPTATDTVVCNYKGMLLDNTEFDSSYSRKQPLTIPVGGVIKGWTEALQLMPVGSKWQLFIPSDLAYGPQQKGPIGPNSTLIFEVELLSIQPKVEPAK